MVRARWDQALIRWADFFDFGRVSPPLSDRGLRNPSWVSPRATLRRSYVFGQLKAYYNRFFLNFVGRQPPGGFLRRFLIHVRRRWKSWL